MRIEIHGTAAEPRLIVLHSESAKERAKKMTDYTTMENTVLMETCGTDVKKWAKAFMQFKAKIGKGYVSETTIMCWFGLVIDNYLDPELGKKPKVLEEDIIVCLNQVRDNWDEWDKNNE